VTPSLSTNRLKYPTLSGFNLAGFPRILTLAGLVGPIGLGLPAGLGILLFFIIAESTILYIKA